MTFLILTQEQAEAVATDALRPVEVGGQFILPPEVLDDATHEAQWALLRSLPRGEVEIPAEGEV